MKKEKTLLRDLRLGTKSVLEPNFALPHCLHPYNTQSIIAGIRLRGQNKIFGYKTART